MSDAVLVALIAATPAIIGTFVSVSGRKHAKGANMATNNDAADVDGTPAMKIKDRVVHLEAEFGEFRDEYRIDQDRLEDLHSGTQRELGRLAGHIEALVNERKPNE